MENQDIRKAGLKVTLPRVKILEILESSESRHMTAEDVYKALLDRNEEIGLATVYRVLTQFVSAGLAEKHHFEGGQAVFELDRGSHHDHIVCEQCGRVEEFVDETIEKCQRQIAAAKGGQRIVDIPHSRCRGCHADGLDVCLRHRFCCRQWRGR